MTQRIKACFLIMIVSTQSFLPLFGGASVVDWADLPSDAKTLLEQIQEVKVCIDQLINLLDELDHWKDMAQKLMGRDGFRLRDIEDFYTRNSLGLFYSGPSALGGLADAIDSGASARVIAQRLKRVFDVMPMVEEWETGTFKINGELKDRMEVMQQSHALGYSGITEGLATVGNARISYEENKEVIEFTRDVWENPNFGEQESLDMIHVQLSQLIDLLTQEQALLTGLTGMNATTTNQAMVYESEGYRTQAGTLLYLSNSIDAWQPVNDQAIQ